MHAQLFSSFRGKPQLQQGQAHAKFFQCIKRYVNVCFRETLKGPNIVQFYIRLPLSDGPNTLSETMED